MFSRFSFHHRIFILIGLFAVLSIGVMWYFVRPLYETRVTEERTTVVQQVQHFAIRSVDEKLEHWVTIAHYLAWSVQSRPQEVAALIRQQIAFDSSLIQVIVSSPVLTDEFVATNSAHPNFRFDPPADAWNVSQRDSSISILWESDSRSGLQMIGIQKLFRVNAQPMILTIFANSSGLLHLLSTLPVGETFAIRVGSHRGVLYSNVPLALPLTPESWQHLTVMHDVTVDGNEWNLFFSKFSDVPMYLVIGIPKSVIVRPVQHLMAYSASIVAILTLVVVMFGWYFSKQLSKPVTQLVHDVERLKTLDFSRPIAEPHIRELAAVAQTIESMRTVMERYQRINVEKIIMEEWKNKFFLSHSEDCISITGNDNTFAFMNDRFIRVKDELHKVMPVLNKHDLLTHPNIERTKESSRSEQSGPYTVSFHQQEICIAFPDSGNEYFRLHDVAISRGDEHLGSLLVLHDLTTERMIDAMKTEMMNFIVHELRNPLNSIMGFASFIMDEPEMGTDERMEYVRIIKESSRTMNRLVNRFLDVQRLESHSVEYHREPADLVVIAKGVCDSQQPQLHAKSLQLNFSAEADIPHTTVAPDLMREAFLNLISNAVKYGDEHRTIDVEMHRSNNNILFIITDHGFGISAEDQQKLFSKFFRVTSNKQSATELGTGLGLAHVKQVMNHHNGGVALESNEQIGCRFTLTIPIV
ncbi:MAG: HAMP domain-containing sensor histidine kinase [Bacteroidota bacterium]